MEHNHIGNAGDREYAAFLDATSRRYAQLAIAQPIFQTDIGMAWELYLGSFTGADQQHHNCNACRHFIHRYAGLVVIDPGTGRQHSALWDETAPYVPQRYRAAVARLRAAAEGARVIHPFYSELNAFGTPRTGEWVHLHALNPVPHNDRLHNAGQRMSAKRQDFIGLRRALDDYSVGVAKQALQLLQAEALTRHERFTGPMQFFVNLHEAIAAAPSGAERNIIWLAVAQNEGAFTHVGTSVLGELMDDIKKGKSFADIKRRFASMTSVTTYQRAQVAPRMGQIEAAEKAVQALGIAPAFLRRYTQLSDLQKALWLPRKVEIVRGPKDVSPSSVFGHLKQEASPIPELDIPAKKVTWEKFVRDILPGAASIQYRVPVVGRFCALTAAADADAPNILQWDTPDRRNTVSWSFPQPAARASEWNLQAGEMANVQLIVPSPNLWQPGFEMHGKGAFLLLEGAKDTRGHAGGGLFPEHIHGTLKPYRAVIEAHMNKLVVAGADSPATMAFGIGLMAGGEFTETAAPKAVKPGVAGPAPDTVHVILVIDDSGSMRSYIGAARNAVSMLLDAVKAMPGKVDVTAIKFGNYATTLCERASVAEAMGCIYQMDGRSGNTALNDTLVDAIHAAVQRPDAARPDTSFFLGIVTDGEENHSRRYSVSAVKREVQQVIETGRWTVAYAGGGLNPRQYADAIGIPEGNVTVFEASSRGFEDVGALYASSTRTLAQGYASGQRASTSFFASGVGDRALGKDHPVLLVTNVSGTKMAYEIDRWD
jgi:hypothetical protein